MTKVAGITASRAPYLAAAAIASGPLMLSVTTTALGQSWEGNHSTDWFTEDNWSGDIIPNKTQDVYIDTTAPNSAKVTNKTTNGTAGAQRLHVGERGEGTLTVSDGGAVSSTHGYIGHFSGSTGTVEVTSTGAAWDNSVDLFIGDYGDGTLRVSDGGAVSSEWGYVGYNSGSTGTVEVTGIGSTLEILETLYIGEGGEGTLTISEGGSVIGTNGYIGGNNGSTGSVEVTGTGATWSNSNILLVGEHGDSTLTVSDGGVVSSAYGIIGGGSDSTGTVEVTGTGTTWNNSSSLQVGLGGDGTLTIFEGATVSVSGATELGAVSTSSGVLNIGAGSGETAVAAGTLDASTVEFGDGMAKLVFNHTDETGAYQFDADLASTGSGTHSIVHESGWTDLSGNNANFTGTTVVNGGTLSVSGSLGSSSGIIGSQSGSTGIVEISGIGSIWENSEDLYIGEHGEGTLTISNGGAVSDVNGFIANSSGSIGTVEVTGTGSTWSNSSTLYVGEDGDGTVAVSDGGAVSSRNGYIGDNNGSTGSVEVTGIGSTWDNSGILVVGASGRGTLTVSDGGAVSNATGYIGSSSVSTGTVEVTGTGANWENSDTLFVGHDGEGTLTISEGATVSVSGATELGSSSTGSGVLNIGAAAGDSALGAGVLNSATLTFGTGTGTINFNHTDTDYIFTPQIVGNGAVHQLSGTTILSTTNSGYTGGTTVSGGVLDVRNGNALANTGDVSVNGGRLLITNTETVGDTAVSGGSLEIGTGATLFADAFTLTDGTVTGGTLKGSSYTVENGNIDTALTGTGPLTKTGTGIVRLTGTNTYTGGTTVSEGVLVVDGSISDVTINGGTLGGSGTINGSATVTSGTISVGNSPGTLTIGGDLNLTSASVLDFELGSPSGTAGVDSDLITVGDDLTLDGSLNVTDAGGFDAGVYNLITYGGSLTDNGLVVGTAPTGFLYNVQTATAGQVNLLVNPDQLSFWNGAVTSADGTVHGGSGTWSTAGTNWTDATGSASAPHQPDSTLIFQGTPGTVTVDSAGVSVSTGMQFATDGYSILGGDITLTGEAGFRVGDGTSAGAGYSAIVASNLTGTGSLEKNGFGKLVLTGTNTYTGDIIVSGGKLVVNGTIGDVTVDGGSLGGSGTIIGSATVTSGTIAAGNSPGTLTIGGDLNLTSASVLDFELGSPSGTAGVDSDLIAVGGDLTLDGSLNVTDAGGFDAGVYNLITYGGSLINNGLVVGTAPTGFLYNVQTATAGQVNLLVNPDQLSFWNGAVTSADGTVHGGSGAWSSAGTNWTDATGSASAPYQPNSTLIFQGTPGTITVDSAGGSVSKGMQFAVDGYSVTGGDVALNARSQFDNISFRVGDGTNLGTGFTSTIASNLTGTGSLQKTGLGTLVLTGDNTYNGSTTVSEGVLEFRDGATLSEGQFFRVGGSATASLIIADGSDVSARIYTFVATGAGSSGAVTVTGPGTRFQAGSTFGIGYHGNGALSILEGGLVSGISGNIGSYAGSTGTVEVTGEGSHWKNDFGLDTQGISLAVGRDGTGTLTIAEGGRVTSQKGVIGSGAGSSGDVVVTGDGSLWENSHYMNIGLLGRGTLTISDGGVVEVENSAYLGRMTGSSGTLNIGAAADDLAQAAGVLDAAAVKFGDGAGVINFNHTDTDYTFSADISGTGSVNQLAGTTILTGTNTYTGGTTVSGGKLVVNGTIGNVTINGGSLGGSGTVGAVAFNSGAVIAPGNSIGTLNATSLVFNSGSTFEVELNDGGNAAGINNDLLDASGTVTINGGTVHVKPENGTDDGSTYAANTVYTIISAVGGVSGTFDSSTPTDDFAFLDFALSYDASNVYLSSQMATSTFCIPGMSSNQCATGEGTFSLGSGSLFNSVLNLSNSDAPEALDQLSGEAHASIKTALIEDSRFVREAALNRVRIAMDSIAVDGQEQVEKRVGESLAFWGQSFGSWGRWSGNSNAAALDRSIGGFLLGGDVQIGENSRLGFFGGYDNSSFKVNSRTTSATADTLHLGAYGGTEFGPLGLRAGASYAWHDIDTTRSVAFTGFAENLSGSHTAQTAQIFGEAGYRFDYAATSLEPFANLSYIQLSSDGYSETGGSAALKAGRQTMDSTFTSIGLRAETWAKLGQFAAKLSAQAAWQHAFGDVTPVANHAFAGGDDFSVAGIPIARDALLLNLGTSVDLGRNTTLDLAYDGQFGSGFTDQGLKANIAVKF
ncbi:protein containing Outer membrane autotransporter barrel domain [Pseudovibrio sp. FO-BEG1]|uniref:autotransporter domain-containing protein n=1 Tax=Pseudovibrio sp. (strain FO-BEG1) TaxID=911045 RepID=UPI000238C5B7|nr:autotransporter domain-containing protein [Pseudovibrio sp. FO-BEG1]AEV37819.1 protein containing Outer membrane autotransporter barrel domain [Pseudovibrio sp. FO-BEG1]